MGKESDIFEAIDEDGNEIVLKIHRLGRTSFRSVRRNRDYMKGTRRGCNECVRVCDACLSRWVVKE